MASLLVVCAVAVAFLWVEQRRAYSIRTNCVSNLVHLRLAKVMAAQDLGLTNGAVVPINEMNKHLFGGLGRFQCRKGGVYVIGEVGALPRCSYTNECHTFHFEFPFKFRRASWRHSLESHESWGKETTNAH